MSEEKENTGIRSNEPANKFGRPAHDDKQQQEAAALLLQQQQYSNTQSNSSSNGSSSSSSSSSTLYAYKTDFSIAQTTRQSSSYIFLHWNKKKVKTAHKKKRHPRFEPRTTWPQIQRSTCYPTLFLVYIARDWYVSIRTNRGSGYFGKRNENSTRRRETTRAWLRPPPAESGETSKVRHVEQTPL